MVTLFRNVRKMSIGGVYCTLRATSDGEKLYVTVGPAAGARIYTVAPSMTLTYAGETKTVTEAESDVTVDFSLTEEKSLTVGDATVWIDGVTYPDGYTFTWETEPESVEEVGITYSIDKIRAIYTSTITFTLTAEDDRILRPVELSCIFTGKSGRIETKSCEITDMGGGVYKFENSLSEVIAETGARIQYRIEAASYTDEASSEIEGGEHFVGFGDVFTPSYIISGGQSTPYALTIGTPVSGCDVRVKWEALADAKTFTLERKLDGGAWSEIYSGADKVYVDKIDSGASTVAYRVRSLGSPWWESSTLEVRQSNMYIGSCTGIRPVAELYLGRVGETVMIPPIMTIGAR